MCHGVVWDLLWALTILRSACIPHPCSSIVYVAGSVGDCRLSLVRSVPVVCMDLAPHGFPPAHPSSREIDKGASSLPPGPFLVSKLLSLSLPLLPQSMVLRLGLCTEILQP